MPKFELHSFRTDADLADEVASRWLAELNHQASNNPFCVALSGGRIARRFYAAITEKAKSGPGKFSSAHFFWGDERCVPPTDPESNFGLARDLLLGPLRIPEPQIHRVRGEDPPEAAAAAAAADLRRSAPPGTQGQPVLDLVLLGMGEDGHIASLFPGEPEAVMQDLAVFRAVTASKPPPRRITLGYGAIAAARRVWVLASGAGKETALRQSLTPGGTTPLARMLGLRTDTVIFTDIKSAER